MSFSDNLLKWYDDQNIKFPWRNISNPYYTWVSEIMLQQTQVKTVIPYFEKWIKNFPTIESVANANDDEVAEVLEDAAVRIAALASKLASGATSL